MAHPNFKIHSHAQTSGSALRLIGHNPHVAHSNARNNYRFRGMGVSIGWYVVGVCRGALSWLLQSQGMALRRASRTQETLPQNRVSGAQLPPNAIIAPRKGYASKFLNPNAFQLRAAGQNPKSSLEVAAEILFPEGFRIIRALCRNPPGAFLWLSKAKGGSLHRTHERTQFDGKLARPASPLPPNPCLRCLNESATNFVKQLSFDAPCRAVLVA